MGNLLTKSHSSSSSFSHAVPNIPNKSITLEPDIGRKLNALRIEEQKLAKINAFHTDRILLEAYITKYLPEMRINLVQKGNRSFYTHIPIPIDIETTIVPYFFRHYQLLILKDKDNINGESCLAYTIYIPEETEYARYEKQWHQYYAPLDEMLSKYPIDPPGDIKPESTTGNIAEEEGSLK